MKKVGIIGGAGYTAGELIRLLINHSEVEIAFVFSTSNAGNVIGAVHQDLAYLDIHFTDQVKQEVDVVFLCLGHGNSAAFLKTNTFLNRTKIIDLSNEFRLQKGSIFENRTFTYGLPELNKKAILKAQNIANPGCFATAIQLALLPLANSHLIQSDVHINAVTGATGAGVQPSPTTHFGWRDNNFSHYKAFEHQHLDEIEQSVRQLQNSFEKDLLFIPQRGNFSRGIFATSYLDFDGSIEDAYQLYEGFYSEAKFTKVLKQSLHLKQVINTNYCFLHLQKRGGKLLITSVLDNLLKGASGQAVENMNLMFGWKQEEGLQLKATYF